MQGAAKLDWNIHGVTPWMNLQNSSLSAGGTSYSLCIGGLFYGGWGVKLTFRPLYSVEVKMEGEPVDAHPRAPLPAMVLLYGVDRDDFTLLLRGYVFNFFGHQKERRRQRGARWCTGTAFVVDI